MTLFEPSENLIIGSITEVSGSRLRVAISSKIDELSKNIHGAVYHVGQVGSLIKFHYGRRIIFASVRMLRMESESERDGEVLALSDSETRYLEADLFGEGHWDPIAPHLSFNRGVRSYPLPRQNAYLVTSEEADALFTSLDHSRSAGNDALIDIGLYAGATTQPCRMNIDKAFGQHMAILGSTGSGKSSAVAAIIHSTLKLQNAEKGGARIILIDPHGEYAAAFGSRAKVLSTGPETDEGGAVTQLCLPYWLMSSDELRSLFIGKTEFEATSQSNVIYQAVQHARMVTAGLVQSAIGRDNSAFKESLKVNPTDPILLDGVTESQVLEFNRDWPIYFSIEELIAHIDNYQNWRKMAKGWDHFTPAVYEDSFGSVLRKLRILGNDRRISFLMDQKSTPIVNILQQFFRQISDDDPGLKIIDISLLPNEVAGPLTGAICRLIFNYKLHQKLDEREKDPITIFCEEAHRYVPDRGEAQYEVAQSAIRKIAREGRKYGIGLVLISQRPADIESTVISQCNTWLILRLTNQRDQSQVANFLPDTMRGLVELLPALPRQEALFIGEGAAIPSRIRLRKLNEKELPSSGDISFARAWSENGLTDKEIGEIATRMVGN